MGKFIVIFTMVFSSMFLYAGKKIVVDLTNQVAYAYENGHEVFRGNVSTGRPGRRTPVGHFRVLEKDIDHVSSKYPRPNGGARMNYMLRLTNYGVAMHLGYVPNYPASHGCVRMENGFAQRMYHWARVGTPVIIKGTPPKYVVRDRSNRYNQYVENSRMIKRVTNIRHNNNIDPLMMMSSIPSKQEEYKRISNPPRRERDNSYQRISEDAKIKPLDMLKS